MILTTNLENMIAEAYFRRFNIKMKFSFPDKECRKKLWQLHLHQDIPGSDTIDLDLLASRYLFTGGQISLVIQNACSEAITRKGKQRVLTIDDIIKYSDLEQPWQMEQDTKSIGFER